MKHFGTSFRAISPVLAVLAMIVIAIAGSLVTYSWAMGYIDLSNEKAGQDIRVHSIANHEADLIVYVQNTGEGAVQLEEVACLYVNGELVECTISGVTVSDGIATIDEGKTAVLTFANGAATPGEKVDIKVTTLPGGSSEYSDYPAGTASEPPVLAHFTFDTIESPQTSGVTFSITIRAVDQYGNHFANYFAVNTLTCSGVEINPSATGGFLYGIWTGEVTVNGSATNTTLTTSAKSNSAWKGTSNTFDLIEQLVPVDGDNVGWMHWSSDLNTSFSYPYVSQWSGSQTTPFIELWNQPSTPAKMALTGDLLGNGKLEVVVPTSPHLNCYDCNGNLVWSANPVDDSSISGAVLGKIDIENVGGNVVVLAEVHAGTETSNGPCAILVYSGDGTLLKTIQGPSTLRADQIRLADLKGDGYKTVVVSFESGYPLSPRGVYAYDYDTGDLLWSYQMGACPRELNIFPDNNNPNQQNILIGTFAPCNGYSAGTTNDYSVYAIVLNPDGQEVLKHQFVTGAQHHVRTAVADVNGDGAVEIVALIRSDPQVDRNGPNNIYIMDADTGDILKQYTGPIGDTWHGFSIVTNSEGETTIFCVAESGKLYAFDSNLDILAENNVGGNPGPLPLKQDDKPSLATASLYSGEDTNIVVLVNLSNGTQQVRVYDSSLVHLWTFNLPETTSDYYYHMIFVSNLEDGINNIIVAGPPGILVLTPKNAAVS